MNTNICTSIKQSKKLIELGLDANTADMCWGINSSTRSYNNIPYLIPWKDYTCKEYYVPTWSLSALFNVMPQINDWITPHGHKDDKLSQFEPKICKIWEHSIIPSYKVTYGNGLATDIYDNPIDAAFEMVCWLLENKKL